MTRWGEFDDLRIDELEEAESTKLEHPTQGSYYIQVVSMECISAPTTFQQELLSHLKKNHIHI